MTVKYDITGSARQIFESAPLTLMDIGAHGDIPVEWVPAEDLIKIVGFEPITAECERLQQAHPERTYYPTALWKEQGEVDFYISEMSTYSGLLPPNLDVLTEVGKGPRIANHRDGFNTIKLNVDTIDNVLKGAEPAVDFIKIDTQGADILVLEGGLETMRNSVLGIMIETHMVEVYQGQPFFSDADVFLRKHGFRYVNMLNFNWWRTPEARDHKFPKGRLLGWDALYIRDPEMMAPVALDRNSILKLMLIYLVHGMPDLSLKTLNAHKDLLTASEAETLQSYFVSTLRQNRPPQFRGKARIVRLLWRMIDWLDDHPDRGIMKVLFG